MVKRSKLLCICVHCAIIQITLKQVDFHAICLTNKQQVPLITHEAYKSIRNNVLNFFEAGTIFSHTKFQFLAVKSVSRDKEF